MVTSTEFNFKKAFSADCLPVTKLLFEGKGGSVRPGLYKQFEESYRGCFFVVASNSLPACEGAGQEDDFYQETWGPLCTRTDFTCFTGRHKHDYVFPYTENQLAHAMSLL